MLYIIGMESDLSRVAASQVNDDGCVRHMGIYFKLSNY